jgi:dolichol-phosphate mannosyltransferase
LNASPSSFLSTTTGSVEKVGRLLPSSAARAGPVELVLVDDGSTDGCSIVPAHAEGRLEYRCGSRYATNTGWAALYRVFRSSRCRGNHRQRRTYGFAEILGLLACPGGCRSGAASCIIHAVESTASRDTAGAEHGSSLIYRLLVDPRLHTYTSLFRAYRRSADRRVPFQSSAFWLDGNPSQGLLMILATEARGAAPGRRGFQSKAGRTTLAHLGFQLRIVLHCRASSAGSPRSGKDANDMNAQSNDKVS